MLFAQEARQIAANVAKFGEKSALSTRQIAACGWC
jgi:hypothetical protein